MKNLLFLFSFLLLVNCEDKQSKQQNPKVSKSKIEKKIESKKDTIIKPEREFPLLTSENAMDFFLEYEKYNKESKVRLTTTFGNIDIQLFEKTKFHRANFIFLIKNKIFDGTQFHRVVKGFIIQGGNSDDRKVLKKRRDIGKYLLSRDTKRGFKHHRGVISVPSSDIENAYKLASPFEFFITQSNQYHLDGKYTVFGKVIKGMNIVDKINAQETDNGDWPVHNIYIKEAIIIE